MNIISILYRLHFFIIYMPFACLSPLKRRICTTIVKPVINYDESASMAESTNIALSE